MKKVIMILSVFLLMVLLLLINWDGFLNRDRLINSSKNEHSLSSNTTDHALPSDRPKLNIGFVSSDRNLFLPDSDMVREYLEKEFDFNFDDIDCDFAFTHIHLNDSSSHFDEVDLIFADSALDWEGGNATSNYSLKSLYDAGYSLKSFDSYFVGKEGMFSQFYTSLKELTEEHIYFYPALIGFDGNNESLVLSLKNDKNSKGEVVVDLERFYNDKYYSTKRGGPANLRFAKTGEYTISASEPFIVNSFFQQTVYVTSDNKDVTIFLDMVFDSKRIQDQYSRKLKIHGEQIEFYIPTFYVENLKNLFDEVLVENVSYDLDSIYHCNKVKITYLAKDFEIDFDFRK